MLYCKSYQPKDCDGDSSNVQSTIKVANKQFLPLSANVGDVCFVTEVDDYFIFDGVNWVQLSSNAGNTDNSIIEKKRCPYCNTIILDDYNHCKSCGAPV